MPGIVNKPREWHHHQNNNITTINKLQVQEADESMVRPGVSFWQGGVEPPEDVTEDSEKTVGCTVSPEISLREKSKSRAHVRKKGPRQSSAS